jgi:hypothetical protein
MTDRWPPLSPFLIQALLLPGGRARVGMIAGHIDDPGELEPWHRLRHRPSQLSRRH